METIDPARITLRPFELTDAADFFSWASNDQRMKNLKWTALASREQALTTIREICMPHLCYCRSA
ncbi:hypothetical protein CDL15_Pgr001580 [Punica granatum]|uniref:N-acetyltransferase domain-containing protein n=1 Tax=Punica granatum TaxID=22663 RepID=A0A218XAM3_PUNGR|nr:hypothetical protein CDL15_Pgr001580 [Punica granatum]